MQVDNYISESATIGEGTAVWRWTQIDDDAVIGKNCIIGQGVYVGKGVIIGDGSRVMNGAQIYANVEIGENVFIGPNAVLTDNPVPRVGYQNRYKSYIKTKIGSGASIGANATLIAGVTLGECSFVAGGATVTKDVADNTLVGGVPAKPIRAICACGVTFPLTDPVPHALCHPNADRDG